jgi:hypothetical protein
MENRVTGPEQVVDRIHWKRITVFYVVLFGSNLPPSTQFSRSVLLALFSLSSSFFSLCSSRAWLAQLSGKRGQKQNNTTAKNCDPFYGKTSKIGLFKIPDEHVHLYIVHCTVYLPIRPYLSIHVKLILPCFK